MGYNGKLNEKKLAQNLRKQGYSYSEIREKVNVSKDTISRWCRNIPLTADQYLNLKNKKLRGGMKGRLLGAKNQQKRRIEETIKLYKIGMEEVGVLSKRERFIAGISLYLAEGTKADRMCEFTNSDPHLIKFMVKWFCEFCNIKCDDLRGAIWIHDDLSEEAAKIYWNELTGITRFHKTYFVKNKTDTNKIRKNIHRHGVFSIRFSNATIHRKIIGWIAGLLGEAWYNNRTSNLLSPVAQR